MVILPPAEPAVILVDPQTEPLVVLSAVVVSPSARTSQSPQTVPHPLALMAVVVGLSVIETSVVDDKSILTVWSWIYQSVDRVQNTLYVDVIWLEVNQRVAAG